MPNCNKPIRARLGVVVVVLFFFDQSEECMVDDRVRLKRPPHTDIYSTARFCFLKWEKKKKKNTNAHLLDFFIHMYTSIKVYTAYIYCKTPLLHRYNKEAMHFWSQSFAGQWLLLLLISLILISMPEAI